VNSTSRRRRRRSELAIDRLRRRHPNAPAIDRFLSRHDVPVVEGSHCTFLYRGDASAVNLRHWIFGLPSTQAFHRLDDTDLWYLVMELPEGSRVEYKLEITEGETTRLIRDPLNPKEAHDPFGSNSVAHATGYCVPEWTEPDPQARQGVLQDRMFHSRALGGTRPVSIYLPARFRPSRRYPLLVVHDGSDYLAFSHLKTVLDNLIHRLEIPALVAVLSQPGDRLREYGADERHARYLTEELVPALENELPLMASPAGRCLMGASFGAVAALHAAWKHPGFYGRLLLQSGSFAFTDIGEHQRGPVFDPVVEFVNEFRGAPEAISRKVYVSCGMYESLIYENRSLLPLLQRTGMEIRYTEARDGHNWENWRDRLREGLSWLFPGPLWMIYE
jgi:enterochelin esterase family protein